MLLPVILHPDVTNFLRTEFQRNLKDSTWKCIDKLRQQNFDAAFAIYSDLFQEMPTWSAGAHFTAAFIKCLPLLGE